MRRSAGVTLATLGIGAGAHHMGHGPIGSASAFVATAGIKAAEAIKYVAEKVTSFFGTERDLSGFTGGDALITATREDIVENQSADERVLTSIENNIETSKNVALAKGKNALLTEMNNGAPVEDANTAMTDAIDEYYSTIQQNVLTHSDAQHNNVISMFDQLQTNDETTRYDVFIRGVYGDRWSGHYNLVSETDTTLEYELVNGETVEYEAMVWVRDAFYNTGDLTVWIGSTDLQESTGFGSDVRTWNTDTSATLNVTDQSYGPVDTDEDGDIIDIVRYKDALDEIQTKRDEVYNTLSGFAEDVYNAYEPGDIPTEDLVDPITAATELAQDYDGSQGNLAYASMLGIPTDAEATVIGEILNEEIDTTNYEDADGNIIEGDLNAAIDAADTTIVEMDIYTNHVPTDDSGTEIGFERGGFYEPSTWTDPLYIAYTIEDENGDVVESEFVLLENQFRINDAQDVDGNQIDSFQTASTTTQTADIAELEAELQALRDEQERLQVESQEEVTAGGGGGFLENTSSRAIAIGVAGVGIAYALFGGEGS